MKVIKNVLLEIVYLVQTIVNIRKFYAFVLDDR